MLSILATLALNHCSVPDDLDLATATADLVQHAEDAFQDEEPLPGLLPCVVALALSSAGEHAAFLRMQEQILRRVGDIEDPAARAVALLVLVQDPPTDPAGWDRRQALLLDFLEDVQVDVVGIPMGRRGGLAGLSGGGRVAQPSRDRPPSVSTLNTLGWALAARSLERLGFHTSTSDQAVPEPWQAAATWMQRHRKRDGRFPYLVSDPGDAVSTAAGALVLALARPLLVGREEISKAQLHQSAAVTRLLESGLRRTTELAARPPRRLTWESLCLAVLSARLQWCIGSRVLPGPEQFLPEHLAQADLDAVQGRLPFLPRDEETAAFYEQGGNARLLATSLLVLAWTGAGRNADRDPRFTAFADLAPCLRSRLPEDERALLLDLIECDGMASRYSVNEVLRQPDDPRVPLALELIERWSGRDFGLRAAAHPTDEDGRQRWRAACTAWQEWFTGG